MQTRRDQLQAYRFQNRRALAALVTGEPNVLEAPMRRITTTTISGIMIAVLVAAIFALIALIRPATGSAWKQPGAIIVDKNSPSIYVLLSDDKLHPVVNYASAVLAVGQKTDPHVEYVGNAELTQYPHGAAIGIDGLPGSLPPKSSLLGSTWSVCSAQQADGAALRATVTVYGGGTGGSTPIAGDRAVLAESVGKQPYLLYDGVRYGVDQRPQVAASLGLQSATPVTVGTALLNAVPAGPTLRTPDLGGTQGAVITGYTAGSQPVRVGQVIDVDHGQAALVALSDGVAALSKVEAALLATVTVAGKPLPTVEVTKSEEIALLGHPSGTPWTTLRAQFAGLPTELPSFADQPAQHGGVCAVYTGGGKPSFATPPGQPPAFTSSTPTESDASRHGRADSVSIPPGRAGLVKSDNSSSTVYVVAAPGKRFPAASTDVLKGFGYAGVPPVTVAAQVLALIPQGPAFDPTAALLPAG